MMMSRCGMLFYIHTNKYIIRWLYMMMKPQGGYMLIHVNIYVYNDFMMMSCHEDTVMISTTGPYGRPVIESYMGKWYLHSTEAVWEMIAREEWLACRHDASPMLDIPRSTPVWAPYILFSGFLNIKTYVYVYYFQNLYVV